MDDAAAMQRAVQLGEGARVGAGPDPWVGAVIVRDGVVVGEGAHDEYGGPHAEVHALAQAGDRARGATLVVTLEPCSHHARTPPCTDAILEAGVQRVVVGVQDPDQRVAGNGIARLREAGIEVAVGVEEQRARASLRSYLHQRTTGGPWCVVKAALSIDGRTVAADGTSRWITGPEARADAHRLRARAQAIAVGSGTALADQPRLTVRDTDENPPFSPLRVLLDARARVRPTGPLFDTTLAPTLVCTTSEAPAEMVAAWKEAGAEVEELPPGREGGVDLVSLLALLGRRDVIEVLVEGGPSLSGSFVRDGLLDEAVLYVAAKLLGEEGAPLFRGVSPPSLVDAPDWTIADVVMLGPDLRLRCLPQQREQ